MAGMEKGAGSVDEGMEMYCSGGMGWEFVFFMMWLKGVRLFEVGFRNDAG